MTSISSIRQYKNCEVKAYVFDKNGLGYKQEPSESMLLGTYTHKLLEGCHIIGNKVKDLTRLDAVYLTLRQENMKDAQLVNKAYNFVQQLQRFYERSNDPLLDMVVVESEIRFDFDGYSGIIDLVVTDGTNYYVVDYKTSKSVLDFGKRILFDEQLQLYCVGSKYTIKGAYFVGIKTKEVMPTAMRTSTGKISVSKSNKVSYESFVAVLQEEGIPQSKYTNYIDWLKSEGANNVIEYAEYSPTQISFTMKRLEDNKERIESISSLSDCVPNVSYKCVSCPIMYQCLQLQQGIEPDFSALDKPERVKVSLASLNKELFG